MRRLKSNDVCAVMLKLLLSLKDIFEIDGMSK
jgi:hypothetical protein